MVKAPCESLSRLGNDLQDLNSIQENEVSSKDSIFRALQMCAVISESRTGVKQKGPQRRVASLPVTPYTL